MNVKSLMTVAVVTVGMVACAESFFIPETSDQHLQQYKLRSGEISYKINSQYLASLMIGNDTKQPFYVSDDRAMKCMNLYEELDQSQLSIIKSPNVTYDNGTYFFEDRRGLSDEGEKYKITFTISAPPGYILGNFSYDKTEIDYGGRMWGVQQSYSSEFKENSAVLTVTIEKASAVKLWNFTAKVKHQDFDIVNDTTLDGMDFAIIDKGYVKEDKVYGSKTTTGKSTFHLSGLRSWVASLYHGNLGVDWSDYPAVKNVNMNGKAIVWNFGKPMVGYQLQADKLGTYIDGNRAMYIMCTEQDPISGVSYDDAFVKVTEITHPDANKMVYITFEYQDIPNIDMTCWCSKYTGYLDKGLVQWVYLKPLELEVLSQTGNNGIVKIKVAAETVQAKDRGFWQIVYDKELKETISGGGTAWVKYVPQIVVDAADMICTKDLVIRSTSGNKFFKFNVDDSGNITATEYTKKINLDEY